MPNLHIQLNVSGEKHKVMLTCLHFKLMNKSSNILLILPGCHNLISQDLSVSHSLGQSFYIFSLLNIPDFLLASLSYITMGKLKQSKENFHRLPHNIYPPTSICNHTSTSQPIHDPPQSQHYHLGTKSHLQ